MWTGTDRDVHVLKSDPQKISKHKFLDTKTQRDNKW